VAGRPAAAVEPDRVAALIEAHRAALAELREAARAYAAADSIEAERTGCPVLHAAWQRMDEAGEIELAARIDLAIHQPATPAGRRAKAGYRASFDDVWDFTDLRALLVRLIEGPSA
jgi:hypothetical protein